MIGAGGCCIFCNGDGDGRLFFGRPSGIFAGVLTGVNFRRCFLFLIVILLEPKVITLNCLCSLSAVSLNHDATLVPTVWMIAKQVLNEDTVTNL